MKIPTFKDKAGDILYFHIQQSHSQQIPYKD